MSLVVNFAVGGIVVAGVSLFYAYQKAEQISRIEIENDRVAEICDDIHAGAMAFLRKEYSILFVVVAIVALLVAIGIGPKTAVCFLLGAACSAFAGFCGMKVATKANARTAEMAAEGIHKALDVAFSGGAVMGFCVVGLGLLGICVLSASGMDITSLQGFGLGASSIALFARVGGGIFTKAADVGADLVGKVEKGIPEDDPRNPAVIADNVGDNVGDVAGMGADLFESYAGAIIAAMVLAGTITYNSGEAGMINITFYPILIAILGLIASLVGALFVKTEDPEKVQHALDMGTYIAGGLFVAGILASIFIMFPETLLMDGTVTIPRINLFYAITAGLICGLAIGKSTEIYTSGDYDSVKEIASQSLTGPATNIIAGMSLGMISIAPPIVFICIAIAVSHHFVGVFGVALAAIGMLSITGMIVAVDAYGPIADNAGGIAEMAHMPKEIRAITDKLDSVGNTTAAIGKGFAIGSAALTALALFTAYSNEFTKPGVWKGTKPFAMELTDPYVVIGLFIGAVLPFLFSAITMKAVGRAAYAMINEVRRQFKEFPGIMEGTEKPDYERCVSISTESAIREMMVPGILAIVVPLVTGWTLGPAALGGLLAGSLVTGVCLAIMMANAGGAWDNTKKLIEQGAHGGKGSDEHKAAVVGDTVGDPFKDTSGPSLNILLKLMTIISLVAAPTFI